MQRARITQNVRRTIVVAALVAASAVASVWRTTPNLAPAARVTVNLVPALFTTASAQFTQTGCTGTPKPNDADLGGASGVLAIAMNSIKLVDYGANNALGGGDDTELELLGNPPTPVDLNFAATSGSNVGSFASNVQVTSGTYEALKITVDDVFRIKCAVTCSGTTYRTQGSSTLTSPDSTALPAQTSSISLTGSDNTATFPFATPFVVTDGGSTTKTIGYAASGACELWNIPGGVKIMPASLTASIQ